MIHEHEFYGNPEFSTVLKVDPSQASPGQHFRRASTRFAYSGQALGFQAESRASPRPRPGVESRDHARARSAVARNGRRCVTASETKN
jgi:hypothetical protein